MFMSSVYHISGIYFSDMVEDYKFTWHQFHVECWGERDIEEHTPVSMHNTTGYAVPLTWILLNSQSTVDLITNKKIVAHCVTRHIETRTSLI